MADILAPKDLESLSKLGELMAVPFFGAAAYLSFGLWAAEYFDDLLQLTNASYHPIAVLAKAFSFFISIGAICFLYYFIPPLIISRWPAFMFFLGMSLLSFGVLGIGNLASGKLPTEVNIFWHLGALCWGFHIFAPVKIKDKPKEVENC